MCQPLTSSTCQASKVCLRRTASRLSLVNSYISDSNTLVLCVMEGTDAVLDKGNALKVVIDANKLGSTILALTKSDKVHEDDTEDYIFKRILLEPGSTPALGSC